MGKELYLSNSTMADEPHQEGSFTSFWQRSADKISSKAVKFMPNVTKPGSAKDDEDGTKSAATQKAHRRAQHLEEDVIRLREMIAAAENEASLLAKENGAMKSTLSNVISNEGASDSQIWDQASQGQAFINSPFSQAIDPSSTSSLSEPGKRHVSPGDTTNYLTAQHDMLSGYLDNITSSESNVPMSTYPSAGQQISYGPSISPSSYVSVRFDEAINDECLQISSGSSSSDDNDIFAGAENVELDFSTMDLSKPLPPLPGEAFQQLLPIPNESQPNYNSPLRPTPPPKSKSPTPDLSLIAINFILALEHPCRTHFQHRPNPPPPFDPEGSHTGHELMASTHVYVSAPATSFNFSDPSPSSPPSAPWPSPSLSLAQLHAMSQSLPKDDYEITPVQAWFEIVERYDVQTVVQEGKVKALKRALGPLVGCFDFGAVMEAGRFRKVVDEVMGS
ncbi:alanine racemase protein [Rutstroemia sp. NJR-2017a BVV2]|nr:alanine racemase protein [Rutstroemia sp. NJR-2017a BVV2]